MIWDFSLIIHSKSPISSQDIHDNGSAKNGMSILFQDIPQATLARLGGPNSLSKQVQH